MTTTRRAALPFVVAASLVAAACGSSADSTIDAASTDTLTTDAASNSIPPEGSEAGDTLGAEGDATETADNGTTDNETTDTGSDEPGDAGTNDAAGGVSSSFESSRLSQVMAAQEQIQSGRFNITAVLAGGDETGVFEMSGQFNTPAGTSETTMLLGDMAALASEGDSDLGEVFAEPIVVRTIGDDAYVTGGIFSMFTGTEGWVKLGADDAEEITADLGAGLGTEELLAEFEGKDITMTELGRDTVDGTETTQYLVSVDDGDIGDLNVWIDDNDILRRLITVQPDEDNTFGPASTITITMEYFDLGEPVEIVPPPADQIVDESQLEALLGE